MKEKTYPRPELLVEPAQLAKPDVVKEFEAVAMNIKSSDAKFVLVCPAWKR